MVIYPQSNFRRAGNVVLIKIVFLACGHVQICMWVNFGTVWVSYCLSDQIYDHIHRNIYMAVYQKFCHLGIIEPISHTNKRTSRAILWSFEITSCTIVLSLSVEHVELTNQKLIGYFQLIQSPRTITTVAFCAGLQFRTPPKSTKTTPRPSTALINQILCRPSYRQTIHIFSSSLNVPMFAIKPKKLIYRLHKFSYNSRLE